MVLTLVETSNFCALVMKQEKLPIHLQLYSECFNPYFSPIACQTLYTALTKVVCNVIVTDEPH